MKRAILILTLITLILLTASSVCASEDAQATEISKGDAIGLSDDKVVQQDEILNAEKDLDELSADISTYSELSNEIGSGGDKNLTHSYYKYDGSSNTISITTAGIIDGKGATIDMAGSNIQTLNVKASGVTIKNLTIKNAKYAEFGGAISFAGHGTFTVENCNFIANTADRAGAIYIDDYSNFTVKNCNFNNNKVAGDIFNFGGAIYLSSYCTYNVENCNFTDNAAEGGGAIYLSGSGTVTNCNFVDNSAYEFGGAIYLPYSSICTVENCNFKNNKVIGENAHDGGAIYSKNSVELINCNFTNNDARTGGGVDLNWASVSNCNFNSNSAYYSGGAIEMGSGNVSNCNFTDNKISWDHGNGGAIGMGSGSVSNCNFNNNDGTDHGGAIYFNYKGNVVNSNFTNNKVTSEEKEGGAIYFSDKGNVENCIFVDNTAETGGAIFFRDDGNVTDSNFVNNAADYRGGAINCKYDFTGNVENCNFFNNTAGKSGGAIYLMSYGNVENCNFFNNTAGNSGGAIYFSDKGNVENCYFVDNTAETGGAIYFMSYGNATNCNFNNNAASLGGAIYSRNLGKVTVDTCLFKTISDTTNQTIYLPPTLNVDNSTSYKSSEKLLLDFKTNSGMSVSNANISVSIYHKNNNTWICDYSCLSGNGWVIDLPAGYYYAVFNTEYDEFQPINRTITVLTNIEYYVNVTSLTTSSKTVKISAKSNIPNDIIQGKMAFILPNGNEISANYNDDGTWWAVYKFNNYGKYDINARYTGLNGVIINKATIEVKDTSEDSAKKTTPKITAKNKSFKTKTKTKKYTVTLKDNLGKVIKKAGLTLKVKGKTYKATTNSKGKATFKITKLNKKGKYKATITYKGNTKYNKITKKVKITVK